MTRTVMLALLAFALLAAVPGAEATCHMCIEDVERDCVGEPDAEACGASTSYLAQNADHALMHLLSPDASDP